MPTTIKLSDETKQLLDSIQTKMTQTFHKKKTLSELVDILIQLAVRHEDELSQVEKLPVMKLPVDLENNTLASKLVESYKYPSSEQYYTSLDIYTDYKATSVIDLVIKSFDSKCPKCGHEFNSHTKVPDSQPFQTENSTEIKENPGYGTVDTCTCKEENTRTFL